MVLNDQSLLYQLSRACVGVAIALLALVRLSRDSYKGVGHLIVTC